MLLGAGITGLLKTLFGVHAQVSFVHTQIRILGLGRGPGAPAQPQNSYSCVKAKTLLSIFAKPWGTQPGLGSAKSADNELLAYSPTELLPSVLGGVLTYSWPES